MRPAEGTRLFFLDDHGVLFAERSQELFLLNTTAAFVWCQIEDGAAPPAIDAALQRTFGLSAEAARACRRQTERMLQSVGALSGFEAPEAAIADEPIVAEVQHDDGLFVAQQRCRLLDSRFRLRFSAEEQYRKVAPILDHLTDAETGAADVGIDVVHDRGGEHAIYFGRRPAICGRRLDELAPLIKSLIWQAAVARHEFFLDIHAGVVGDGEQCFLLPAAAGSGKSTLTAMLVHLGFEYFSDEVALLHLPAMRVEPVPLATCVKESGVAALARYYPGLAGLDVHRRGDGKRVRYLPPRREALPPPQTRRPIGAIVFPRYSPGCATRLQPLSAVEALHALLAECLIVSARLDAGRVGELLGWIAATPCYRLQVCDLGEAGEALRGLSRRLAPAVAAPGGGR